MSKEFDILMHEFRDSDINSVSRFVGGMLALNVHDGDHIQLGKLDVVALALHFDIKMSDIKKYKINNGYV